MYVPAEFAETDIKVIHKLIKQYPFGILVTQGQSGLDANHLPFELDTDATELGVLHAHVARKNPVWQEVQDGDEVLVVFCAGDAYISPQWYPSKQEHHQQVPTWNYRVIHAYGKVTIRDHERYVRGVVARLTRTHEAMQPEPWKMSDAPKNYIDQMLKAIVGLEIEITKIQGKSKLGQNKTYRDIFAVAKTLSAVGKPDISEAMHKVAAFKNQP